MNKTIFGIPVVLLFFICAILLPVLMGDLFIARKIDDQVRVVVPPKVNCIFPSVTPTPSITPTSTPSGFLKSKVVPTVKKTVVAPTKVISAPKVTK